MLVEAELICVHPLCHRWPTASKAVYVSLSIPVNMTPFQYAKTALAPRHRRICRECHRPIAIKHVRFRELSLTDGSYLHDGQYLERV